MLSHPKISDVVAKAFLEVVGIVLLLLPLAYIYIFSANFEPFHRGFFCSDQNLKHPYKEQTVPILTALLVWLGLAIFFIVLVENLRTSAMEGWRRKNPIPDKKYPPWIAVELYRYFGYFALGATGCLLFTEIAKYTIGRLRPHFLTLCRPDFASPTFCKDTWGYERFIVENENEICLGLIANGGNVTSNQLHEARLSFLSGHSSFSFYCASFLVVYLQARLTNFPTFTHNKWVLTIYWMLKVFKPFLQFGMLVLAFWISLTRISDYFHHPYDVATGALVGVIFAAITLLVMADVFNKRSAFWKSLDMEEPQVPKAKNEALSVKDPNLQFPYIDEGTPERNEAQKTESPGVV